MASSNVDFFVYAKYDVPADGIHGSSHKKMVSFEYDPLGRRISKTYKEKTTRWVWDGNVPLHEWTEEENVTTWLFEEGTFIPAAKIVGDKSYSIITDYLGTPTEMFNSDGEKTWSVELDIYGSVRNFAGRSLSDCPFRYQGQYEDEETGLYYNRFRYYSPDEGRYISQDPIGLEGGMNLNIYVSDSNAWIDPFGLSRIPKTGGTWDGTPGNSNWFSNNPKVMRITGGEGIPFKDGLPNFDKWSQGEFEIENLTGTKKDFNLVHQHLKDIGELNSKAEAKRFLKENGLTAHHHPNMKTIQLIPSDLHNNVPHEGGASKLRKSHH